MNWRLAVPRGSLQRLYSSFPAGLPGSILLLLRVAAGVTLIVQGLAYVPELHLLAITTWFACLLMLISGSALLAGFLTRLFGGVAVLSAVAFTFLWMPTPKFNLFSHNPLSFDVVALTIACAVLGPGAFSLDAHLFGRRKIIIPK